MSRKKCTVIGLWRGYLARKEAEITPYCMQLPYIACICCYRNRAAPEKFFPSFGKQVAFTKTYRWEHAAVQFPSGSILKKQALRNVIDKELSGIYVASDSLFKTSIETSLKTGITAAEKLIKALG